MEFKVFVVAVKVKVLVLRSKIFWWVSLSDKVAPMVKHAILVAYEAKVVRIIAREGSRWRRSITGVYSSSDDRARLT